MNLDLSKLERVRCRGTKTIARCPTCAKAGQDRKGEHLFINESGRFGCVVYPGDSPEAKEHRKQIFALCGIREIQPLIVKRDISHALKSPPYIIWCRENNVLDVLNRTLGRQGRFLPYTVLYSGSDKPSEPAARPLLNQSKPEGVPSVPNTQARKPHRPLTDREWAILVRAGAEQDPIIIEALRLFNATVAGVIPVEHQQHG